jgi:hypothetical protein
MTNIRGWQQAAMVLLGSLLLLIALSGFLAGCADTCDANNEVHDGTNCQRAQPYY